MKVRVISQKQEKIIQVKMRLDGNDIAFAAVDDNGNPVANAECEFKPAEDYILIYHIITPDPSDRRKGYGSAIFKAIEYVAYQNYIYDIRGDFAPEDKHTIDAYIKNGFEIVNVDEYSGIPDEKIYKIAGDVSEDIEVEPDDNFMLENFKQMQ